MKIISLSVFCLDHYPEQGVSKPGGNSLNFAIHAKKMNAGKVAVAGFLGDDLKAEQIIKLLSAKNVNTDLLYIKQGKTASNNLYNTPEGERYSKPGEWKNGVYNQYNFSESDYAKILEYDLIAVPYTDNKLKSIIERNKSGKKIVVDFLHFDDSEIISEYLPFIDIAFVSAEKQNLENLEQLAYKQKKMIVATLGADGSLAFYKEKKYFQAALEIDKIIDTTGCGDSYQAGFSITYFKNGNIEEAMYAGAEIASEVLKVYGGVG